MYLDFFGLKEHPFLLTPDADFLFLSQQHAQAKACMDYTLLNRDSFVVITGEIGCGKTTLINKLLSEIVRSVVVARIFQTQVSPAQFLQTVLAQFGIKAFGKRKAELLDIVNNFLIDQHKRGRQMVLIVDEAQNLSMRVLEEIRLLSDVETQKEKILNVILVGQPELQDNLNSPKLEQLAQRTRFRVHLGPFSEDETGEYIEHRLGVAGYEGDTLFDDADVPYIFEFTGGVPRLVNTLCDTALTGAFSEEQTSVSREMLETAIRELNWLPFAERRKRRLAARSGHAESDVDPALETAGFSARDEELPKLLLTLDGHLHGEFPLDRNRLMIGRDTDNEITVVSEFVSRHHAQMSVEGSVCWVKDLNSTNGTYVNGQRIKRRALCDGDIISVGKHKLIFSDPAALATGSERNAAVDIEDYRGTAVIPESTEKAQSDADAK